MLQTKRKIDLNLPSSYHQCSLAQLRTIASVLIDLSQRATPLRPFDMFEYKLAVFILFTNLKVVSPVNPRLPVEDQYYEMRFRAPLWRRIINRITGDNAPFSLYLWQIHWWLGNQKTLVGQQPGCLDWLDPDNNSMFVVFPFSYIKRRHSGLKALFRRITFKGPEPLLNGFSWKQFRFAQDLMDNYIRQQNHLINILSTSHPSQTEIRKIQRTIDTAKATFLATIFERRIRYADEHGHIRRDWRYQSNQSFDNIEYFRNFPDVDWQIILLWWSGIMRYLSTNYPRVFKIQKPGKGKPVNPAEVYARTTATMEKYIGLDADKLDKEPYDVVLRHIDNLIQENEQMEAINRKSSK